MLKILGSVILFLIVLLSFLLRINRIESNPPSLNWDEVSIGYNAYSILKTGRDEWGEFFPVHLRSYGEYKLPLQIYASIPGIAIFGLNEFGVRITPVIYGTATVLLVYFLTLYLFKGNRLAALAASFFLAISPWHIHLTRASFESSFSVFWVTLGILLFVKGLEKSIYWIPAIIPLAAAMYTYNSARVFVPLFLITLAVLFRKNLAKNFKVFIYSGGLFTLMMIPLITFWLSGEATARLKLVSIMDDPGFVQRINVARGNVKLPNPIPSLIHNKGTHFAYVFGRNYLSHFSPDFLFVNGAGHKQHHVQGVGELYAIQAPFVIIGLLYLLKIKHKYTKVLFSWLLLSFIPVSITADSIPHALRTLLAVVPYQIITAYGFFVIWRRLAVSPKFKLMFVGSVVIILLISIGSYLNDYYDIYPKKYSRDWQYGYKGVVSFMGNHYQDYDLIVFTRHYGEPHMFTLFYLNWDPRKFQSDPNLVRFETYDWVRVLKFDKFYFPDLGDKGTRFEDIVKEFPDKKILFIGKQGDFPDNLPKLLTVDFLNGDRAFEIVEER